MAEGFIHTIWNDNEWKNEIEGSDRIPGNSSTKEEAVEAGRSRAIADMTEHVIHNQDGTIGEHNSYGNDPADRPG